MYDRKADKPWTRLTPRDKVRWSVFRLVLIAIFALSWHIYSSVKLCTSLVSYVAVVTKSCMLGIPA